MASKKSKRAASSADAKGVPNAPRTWRERFGELHPRRFFVETWDAADRRSEKARKKRRDAGLGPDWRPFAVLAIGAVVLTVLEYFGDSPYFVHLVRGWAEDDPSWQRILESNDLSFYSKMWWTAFRFGGYFLIPALFVKFVLRERLRDHGLQLKGFRDHLWIYGVATAVVLVLVLIVSYDESFQRKYPMYRFAGQSWRDFFAWEAMYALQFFSLEFFFRGTWLRSLEPAMGGHAITAMVVPYCMIHFGKPWPETIAAIAAGLVLGTLALKSRSIWAGFLVHVTVAVSMDVAALLQTTGLPVDW
ncbi:MAG: CPBP family intramembrane glutamic endopeptidase [Myxococcota bacterium]